VSLLWEQDDPDAAVPKSKRRTCRCLEMFQEQLRQEAAKKSKELLVVRYSITTDYCSTDNLHVSEGLCSGLDMP